MKSGERETLAQTKPSKDSYVEDLSWMMRDPRGRRLMRRWLSMSGANATSWEGSEGRDAAMTLAYNEGRKEFAYRRLAELKRWVPETYLLMEKEGLDA